MADVEAFAKAENEKHGKLDVLINNVGIFNTSNPISQDGLDVHSAVKGNRGQIDISINLNIILICNQLIPN